MGRSTLRALHALQSGYMMSPRYLIAHMLLPAFLREQSGTLVHEAIARGDDEFFIPVWMRAGIRFSPRLLDMSRGDFRIGVMTLPTPREMTEAYLAAAVSTASDPDHMRYFLLEAGPSGTIIGEWTESTHSNFGAGPPLTGNLAVDSDAFVERVIQICAPTGL